MVIAFNQPPRFRLTRERVFRAATLTLLAAVMAFFTWSIVSRRYASEPCQFRTGPNQCGDNKPGVATLPVASP